MRSAEWTLSHAAKRPTESRPGSSAGPEADEGVEVQGEL